MVVWDEKNQSKQTFYLLLSTRSTQVDPSWHDRKVVDSDVKDQAKQIKTNTMLLLSLSGCTLTNSCYVSAYWDFQNVMSHTTPINPTHAPIGSCENTYWSFGYNAKVLDADIRVWFFYDDMDNPENSVWGVGCLENFILVFHRGQSGPGLPFKTIGPISSRGASVTAFIR